MEDYVCCVRGCVAGLHKTFQLVPLRQCNYETIHHVVHHPPIRLQEWGWTKPPPESQHRPAGESSGPKTARKRLSEQEKALREFACGICKKTVVNPVSTPCGHNFCKSCLDERFAGVADEIAGGGSAVGVRSMRARKQLKPCPVCATDLMEFLRSAQVNRDMAEVVRKLQESVRQAKADAEAAAAADGEEAGGDKAEEEEQDESEADKPEEESTEAESAQAEEALNAAPLAGPDSTDSALVAHQMETSAQASPAKGPNRGDATSRCPPETKALIEEFSDFDAGLIEALLEQEDGDVGEWFVLLVVKRHNVSYISFLAASSDPPPTPPPSPPPTKKYKLLSMQRRSSMHSGRCGPKWRPRPRSGRNRRSSRPGTRRPPSTGRRGPSGHATPDDLHACSWTCYVAVIAPSSKYWHPAYAAIPEYFFFQNNAHLLPKSEPQPLTRHHTSHKGHSRALRIVTL